MVMLLPQCLFSDDYFYILLNIKKTFRNNSEVYLLKENKYYFKLYFPEREFHPSILLIPILAFIKYYHHPDPRLMFDSILILNFYCAEFLWELEIFFSKIYSAFLMYKAKTNKEKVLIFCRKSSYMELT